MTGALTSITSPVQPGAAQSTASFGDLAGEEFMALLLAQLRNQNPLEPMDDQQLLNQVTQLTSMQELQSMNATLKGMANRDNLVDGAGLIGHSVQAQVNGAVVEGLVTGASVLDDRITLWLNDLPIPMENILHITLTEDADE